jgi:hypothetical protein
MDTLTKRTTPIAIRQFRTLRIDGVPVQPSSPPLVPKVRQPPAPASDDPEPQSLHNKNDSPAVRAQKAKWRLRRLFETAWHNARGQARLCGSEEYEILRCAYRAVRAWRSEGIQEEIERELRDEAAVAISPRSNLFLVLIRCSLPYLDSKRASKWAAALEYADEQDIHSKRLPAFLWRVGGVEGAARAKAKFGRETSERNDNHGRSPNTAQRG